MFRGRGPACRVLPWSGMQQGRLRAATSLAFECAWSISSGGDETGFRSYRCGVSGTAVRASNVDDDLPPSASLVQIPDGVGDFAQRVRPVEDRHDLARLDEPRQELQVRCVRLRGQWPQGVTHERRHRERLERTTDPDPSITPLAADQHERAPGPERAPE